MVTSLPAMVDLRWEPGGDLILSWTEAPGARNKIIPRTELAHLQRLAEAVSLAESSADATAIVATRTALSALLDPPVLAELDQILDHHRFQVRLFHGPHHRFVLPHARCRDKSR